MAKTKKVKRVPGAGRKCIAKNCRQTSKGPRFHYLCPNHWNAPKRQIKVWQKAQR